MTAVNVIRANINEEYLKYTQSGPPKLKNILPYLSSYVEYFKNNPPTNKFKAMCIMTIILKFLPGINNECFEKLNTTYYFIKIIIFIVIS